MTKPAISGVPPYPFQPKRKVVHDFSDDGSQSSDEGLEAGGRTETTAGCTRGR